MLCKKYDISPEAIRKYYEKRGYAKEKQFVFSFDLDNTIINRDKTNHEMSGSVRGMLYQCFRHPRIIPVINTGRDWSDFLPVRNQLTTQWYPFPLILVAGRVVIPHDRPMEIYSALDDTIKGHVWEHFMSGLFPHLELKTEDGSIWLSIEGRQTNQTIGSYRPRDWDDREKCLYIISDDLDPYNFSLWNRTTAHRLYEDFMRWKTVKINIPVNDNLFTPIVQNHDYKGMIDYVSATLHIDNHTEYLFLPKRVHRDWRDFHMATHGFALLRSDGYHNKATSLRRVARMYKVPDKNIIHFGDDERNGARFGDACVKDILLKSTLVIVENGHGDAKKHADFVCPAITEAGVPRFVSNFMQVMGGE